MATNKNTWKQLERRIAAQFGTVRTALSGSNSKITSSDSLSEKYYLEVKLRAKIPFYKTFKDTMEKAKKENKIPIVVMHQKFNDMDIVMCKLEDFIVMKKAADINTDKFWGKPYQKDGMILIDEADTNETKTNQA
jgi:hypothetical protein